MSSSGVPYRTSDPKAQHLETLYKLPLLLVPQPEGGFTVTCPVLPELLTEADTVEEALANVENALAVTLELCTELDRSLPAGVE